MNKKNDLTIDKFIEDLNKNLIDSDHKSITMTENSITSNNKLSLQTILNNKPNLFDNSTNKIFLNTALFIILNNNFVIKKIHSNKHYNLMIRSIIFFLINYYYFKKYLKNQS